MATTLKAPGTTQTPADALLPGSADGVVVLNQPHGIALIPKPTPLTRLNYYDGKYLRAADMQAEQEYGRRLSQLSNRASGAGVVDGFELIALAGDVLQLNPGLAIDDDGRVLHLPHEATVGIEELIKRSQPQGAALKLDAGVGGAFFALCETATAATTTAPIAGVSLYVVGIGSAEALCGQEDVYGKLCEEACVGGTERPWRLEGVVLRALPLVLATPLPTSTAVTMEALHLRSRVAAAFFAEEARRVEALISAAGLMSKVWCNGAPASSGGFVALGVLARAGGHTSFLDLWTARRERIDTHPRRYWQWRMMMRPWDVFLAQILQFQCQLRDVWQAAPPDGDDPCDKLKRTVLEVSDLVAQLERQYRASSERLAQGGAVASGAIAGAATFARGGAAKTPATAPAAPANASLTLIDGMTRSLQKVAGTFTLLPSDRVLIRRGIVELPSAGYLPVAPGSAISVNEQVRRLMGEGVDLRFCVVRADFVAHALEEVQHMERISLLRGLDNPQAKEEVDILVPDGVTGDAAKAANVGWEVRITQAKDNFVDRLTLGERKTPTTLSAHGAALRQAEASAATPAAANAPKAARANALVGAQPYARDVMSGAARSEARDDGSLALFFAGLAEIGGRDAAIAELKNWAAERDNPFEETLWRSVDLMTAARAADPAPAETVKPGAARTARASKAAKAARAPDDARAQAPAAAPETAPAAGPSAGAEKAAGIDPRDIAGRFAALRTQALDHRLKALERIATTGTAAGISHFAGLKEAPDNDHVAMWLALRAQANPLAVAEGGTVPMSMAFSLLVPKAAGSTFLDVDLVGAQLAIESRVTTGQRVAVHGSLRGAAIIRGLVGTLGNSERGINFNAPVIVTAEPSAAGTNIVVEVDLSAALYDGKGLVGLRRIGVRIATSNEGQAAKVLVRFETQGAGEQTFTIDFGAGLARSDSVLNLGHPLRSAAETALEVLSTRASAPTFAGDAAADLFGQRPPESDVLTIHAKRDWVLFHRRRDKQCGRVAEKPPLEERRYELFHLRVRSDAALRTARAAVISANAQLLTKLGFAPIGAAAYAGGRATLTTPTAALLADWDAAQPGNRLRFGAIGSQGAAQAEGDALARSRLVALETTLMRGEPTSPPENQVLPVLPELNLAGWDGAIFLVTLEEQAICHDVYRVRGEQAFRGLTEAAKAQGLSTALRQFQLQAFAHVEFNADGKTLKPQSDADLRTAWGSLGKPEDRASSYFLGDSVEAAAVKVQSQAIMGALGGNISDVISQPAQDLKEATPCRGITVLVAEPEAPPVATSEILLAAAPWDGFLIIRPQSPLERATLADGQPVDRNALLTSVRNLLATQPISMTAAVHDATQMATAEALRALVATIVGEAGAPPLPQTRVDVLKPREVEALKARGFPPEAYSALVYFTKVRLP